MVKRDHHGATSRAVGLASVLALLAGVVSLAGCERKSPDGAVDATVDARPPCEVPTTTCSDAAVFQCGGHCYLSCRDNFNADDAAGFCENSGMSLPIIDNTNTNDCVAAATRNFTSWTGLRQPDTATSTAEGWRWPDGSEPSFAAWGAGEPNDADGIEDGDEQCMGMDIDAIWRDRPCGNFVGAVCRLW
jgi:hypothetical protein